MDAVIGAIVPILILLGGGALLRRRFLTSDAFWAGLAWMSYWVFTPALFITSISAADLGAVPAGPLVLSVALPTTAVATLAWGTAKIARANGPQLTSVMQGAIRINTYIGLIFASALYGQDGVATFALASAIVVPLVNLICVSTLSVYGKIPATTARTPLWRDLARNPLIIACVIGLGLNLLAIPLPTYARAALEMVATPALACGTLIAGAALHFTFRRRDLLDITIATVLKLAVLPMIAMATAIALGLSGATLASVVLICAVPTAPSAYVLALRMGGDTRLMAAITGIQTVLAVVTMPLMLALAQEFAR